MDSAGSETAQAPRNGRSRSGPQRIAALTFALLVAIAPASAGAARARTARTLELNESARLHLTSHHSFTLNEQGSTSGTIRGTMYIHLTISSTNHVTAEVNIYPSGGSLTGYASASYRVDGPKASFSGTMSIARGTGSYGRAHGSGLGFSGTIQRDNDAVTVSLTGRMSD